uniref:Uncharacterized protein n=1 Tax=Streptomyces sp. NBC_00049 TaxID=2903617 RepID=A0AAU2JMV7_9ACTN
MPVPAGVVQLGQPRVAGHADDVDDSADRTAEQLRSLLEQSPYGAAVGHVAGVRDAPGLGGDGPGALLVQVRAQHPGAPGGEGVGGLPPDAVAGAQQDQTAAVEAVQAGVVGDGGGIGRGRGTERPGAHGEAVRGS